MARHFVQRFVAALGPGARISVFSFDVWVCAALRRSTRLRACVGLLACVFALVTPCVANAQQALAESLFQQARDLLEQGKVAEACPKFAESQRLDPATGTLLGLALCHEQEGKLASAWAEFVEAQGMAKRDGQQKRQQFAKQKARQYR